MYDELVRCTQENILLIVDGAAFWAYMEQVEKVGRVKNILVYMPESFEWMILASGVIKSGNIKDIIDKPYDYIESSKYFSWERFFTDLLKKETNETYLQYKKERLNKVYL